MYIYVHTAVHERIKKKYQTLYERSLRAVNFVVYRLCYYADAVCLFSSTWSLQAYMWSGDVSRCSFLFNIKVKMVRVCVSSIALTSVFSGEQGELMSLMGPLHLCKVFFEELPHGGVD